MSVLGILGVVFIVLKITHVIAWSWLWVLAPFWIPAAIAVAILIIASVVGLLIARD